MTDAEQLKPALDRLAKSIFPGADRVEGLRRLSGGASQETWSFRAVGPGVDLPIILRRAPGGGRQVEKAVGLETEAQLMRLADAAGAPAPKVRHVLVPEDDLGRGFLMDHVDGETLGRKIVRDEAYAAVRPQLARRCGEILALIHNIPTSAVPPIRTAGAQERLSELHEMYLACDQPKPVFTLAFKWLREHVPPAPVQPRLVHGDFRNGNLIIGPDGVRAVLDWEIAHLGDPVEDLGWICVNSWRFGAVDLPVGGFGTREAMLEGYAAAGGGQVNPTHLMFWEMLGTLGWGVACATMVAQFRDGTDPSVERAMIARRASETEIDLLNLLAPRS